MPLFRSRGSGHEDESAVLFLRRFDDFLRLTQLHHSQYYWAFTVALSKLENTTDVATWVEWLREFSKSDTPWNVVSERFKQHFSNPSERFDILDKIENCRQRGRDTQVYTAEYISYFTQLGQPPSMADLLRLIRGFDKWVISALDRHRESMRRSTSDLNWDFEDFTTIQQVANSAVNTNRIASSGDGGGGGGARGAGVRGGRGGRRGGGSRRSNNNNNNNNSSANNVDSSNRSKSSRQRGVTQDLQETVQAMVRATVAQLIPGTASIASVTPPSSNSANKKNNNRNNTYNNKKNTSDNNNNKRKSDTNNINNKKGRDNKRADNNTNDSKRAKSDYQRPMVCQL